MTIIVGTNSYADAAMATEYCVLAGISALATPEPSLKKATIAIDRLYGARFIGTRLVVGQALAWPRGVSTDSFGDYRSSSVTPIEVQQATIELAVMSEAGTDAYAQPEPLVTGEKNEAGDAKVSTTYAFGYAVNPLNKISVILAPLLASTGLIRMVR